MIKSRVKKITKTLNRHSSLPESMRNFCDSKIHAGKRIGIDGLPTCINMASNDDAALEN